MFLVEETTKEKFFLVHVNGIREVYSLKYSLANPNFTKRLGARQFRTNAGSALSLGGLPYPIIPKPGL